MWEKLLYTFVFKVSDFIKNFLVFNYRKSNNNNNSYIEYIIYSIILYTSKLIYTSSVMKVYIQLKRV